jgi:inorganic pyrophosphatase
MSPVKTQKIIAVPHSSLSREYDKIINMGDIPDLLKAQIVPFFQHYKSLEQEKWGKIDRWGDIDEARTEIMSSFKRAKFK